MTTAGRPGSAARSARALASGSRGSVTSRRPSGALEASTPALAHTKPWCVRQISTPRSARTTLARLVEHDLDVARVLAVVARERPRALARHDVGEAPAARPRPSRRPCARPRGRRRARASRGRRSSAPRSSPGRISGSPGSGLGRQATRHRRPRRASSPRVCAAPPCAASSAARSAARSSAVSTSSTSERGSATAPARAAARGGLLVARAAAGAEARRDRVGRREQQRVGPGAVAVGDDDDVGRAHRARRRGRRARAGRAPGSRRVRAARARRRARAPSRRRRRAACEWPRSSSGLDRRSAS